MRPYSNLHATEILKYMCLQSLVSGNKISKFLMKRQRFPKAQHIWTKGLLPPLRFFPQNTFINHRLNSHMLEFLSLAGYAALPCGLHSLIFLNLLAEQSNCDRAVNALARTGLYCAQEQIALSSSYARCSAQLAPSHRNEETEDEASEHKLVNNYVTYFSFQFLVIKSKKHGKHLINGR